MELYYQRQKCRQFWKYIKVYADIRRGSSRRGVKRQWGYQRQQSFKRFTAPPILPADRHCARYKLSYRIDYLKYRNKTVNGERLKREKTYIKHT